MFKTILMVLCSCILGVTGQINLKIGINKIGLITKQTLLNNIWEIVSRVASNPNIWIGLFFFFFSFLIWLVILSRVNLSLAYPLVSMNYILLMIASKFILNEPISPSRILGTAIICLGVILMK